MRQRGFEIASGFENMDINLLNNLFHSHGITLEHYFP